MALIKPLRGFTPVIGRDCFLADNATVIGDVVMGKSPLYVVHMRTPPFNKVFIQEKSNTHVTSVAQ